MISGRLQVPWFCTSYGGQISCMFVHTVQPIICCTCEMICPHLNPVQDLNPILLCLYVEGEARGASIATSLLWQAVTQTQRLRASQIPLMG